MWLQLKLANAKQTQESPATLQTAGRPNEKHQSGLRVRPTQPLSCSPSSAGKQFRNPDHWDKPSIYLSHNVGSYVMANCRNAKPCRARGLLGKTQTGNLLCVATVLVLASPTAVALKMLNKSQRKLMRSPSLFSFSISSFFSPHLPKLVKIYHHTPELGSAQGFFRLRSFSWALWLHAALQRSSGCAISSIVQINSRHLELLFSTVQIKVHRLKIFFHRLLKGNKSELVVTTVSNRYTFIFLHILQLRSVSLNRFRHRRSAPCHRGRKCQVRAKDTGKHGIMLTS